ncbi:MAG: hypothetical protein NUV61_02535 [Candidatus Azambacteria bacterium]|nr:hypothetical protein [Candidatus Azambacteria bacterium]
MVHEQLKRFTYILWNTGNFWGRIFIISLICWPLVLAAVATAGGGTTITSLLALVPFFTLVLGIAIYPAIDAVMLVLDGGRNILKWIAAIIGVELVIGAYFSAMPLSSDGGLVPLLVLVIAALILVSLSQKLTKIKYLLWIALLVLTIIFIAGGREKAKELLPEGSGRQDSGQSPVSQRYMENGLVIKRECTAENIVPKKETPTYVKAIPGLPVITMVANCREDDMITRLEPWEEIDVRHRDFGPLRGKENRCSYNYCGDSIPVGGEVGAVTRARFANDLSFPQFPFGVVVFYIIDDEGKLVDSGYVPHPGGIVRLTNTSSKQAALFSRYNIMKTYFEDKDYKIQVGWDGSTVAYEMIRNTHPSSAQ